MEVETSENVGESATKSGKPSRNKLSCSIACLDGANFNINIEKNAPGKLLVDKICSHLKVDEKEYFGLLYVELKTGLKRWLETYKPIKKQLNGSEPNFEFAVKFFEPNPEQVNNDYTRYLMALQIREEIATGSLPCSFSAQALLGSYVIQSEFGDYDPLQHGQDYLDGLVFAPEQSPELIMKIKELHRSHKGLTPMEADLQYLEYARKLTMYGVDLHEARNVHGADIHVGVSFAGIAIYKDQIRTNKFTWPTIEEVKYKGKNFFVKIKPGEYKAFMTTVVFKTPNDRATKELYKSVVEHHTFYRLREPDSPKGGTLPRLNPKFRYSDRTLFQLRQGAYNTLPRPSTLNRRWSDKYSDRRRPTQRSEGDDEADNRRKNEVPVSIGEATMTDEERRRYREMLAAKLNVKTEDEKEHPMDVVFTFGACGPNADDVFDKEKDMVSGFLETIKVADSYYGVIEYGENQANIMARLGDFRNKERLNQFINTIPRSGEGRAIDKALEKARELLLGSGRNDARKALVIFANGKSSARLAELTKEAKPLHDAGVKIIAVGIGDDVDDEELNSIATNKIIAQPYDEAAPLGHLLAHEVTEAPSKELVDVTFVMGSSGIEGDMIFEKEKEIIQSFVDALKSNDTQIAVVNYGNDDAKVEAKVGQFKDKEDLMSCVNKQTRLGDGKALGKALDKTEKVLSETGRPGIRKAVVVFANGRSGSDNISLAKKARDLHGNDVKVVAVGIGDDVNEDELQALANAGVIMAGRDSDSDVTAGTIVKYLEMISEAAEDALDIAFAFGASGSDADLSFKKAKEMIKIFIDSLKVHDTQYGVIEYSNEARVHATFGQFNRKDRLKAQISSIERRGEAVGLHKALTAAYDLLAKNGRRGARKTLIVFTSGKADASLNEVRDSAKSLQDAGIKIVSVAIGDSADVSQLKEISTNEEVVKCELTGDSDAIIHRVSHDVVSAELSGETVDIVFALGSAGSDAHMVFEKEKEMVATFVNSLDTANLRYALVNYGEDATLQANFNDHKEKYDFKEFLDTLAWPGHGVGLANALEKSAAVFKDSGRVNAKRVLVLFTNAQSNARAQDLQKYSRDLQETAVKVIVVAIGDDVNEEELSHLNGQPMVRHQVHEDLNVIAKTLACDMLSSEADAVQTPVLSPIPKVKLDVVFAIGAAGKDANDVFEKEKLIVNSFIDNLKDNDAQFAIIEFGNKASVKSNLGDEMNAGILAASVADLQRSGEGKCLDKALEQAVEVFHQKARAGSNRVLIVLTNAKSSARTQDLKKHSQSLTDAGVKVQVVAIGNDINEDELVQITSNEIPLLRIQPYEDPHTVLKETAWIIGEKQDEYLDIVFAFGSFGEAAKEIFYKEKQLISSFIDSVQKPDTRYGVIEIGPRAKVCAMIGQYRDHVRLKRHVNLVRRTGDATGLDHALDVAAGMFENQARPNSRRVMVVFTNGKSGAKSEQVKQNSERLIKANVDIIVVAIGDDIDDEECQNVSCGNRPIVCIDPEQNPRAFVYSIVKEIEEVKCVKPTDIVFVIGAAGNGAENIYNKNKEIISKYIEANKVPNTMYSIVDYGPKAVVRSKFGENKQRAILLDHIENLQHPGDGKALDKALEQSLNLLENEGRFGAKKRAVLFTNGNSGASPGHLKKYSSLLEDANVKIITVAVGDDVNDSEIRHVNSDEETIVKVAVDDEPESAVFAVARLVQGPNKVKYDIIFAFGAMGESADMIHLKEKEMIGSFIDSFAAGDYRYAVVEYGSKAYVKAKFDEIRGKDEMKEFVKNIKRSGEGKALDKALEQSHDLFKKYGRPTAKNVLIVFTNGKCNARANELKKYATSLSELGTKLIVVAIGEEVSVDELLHVASNKESIVRAQPEDDCSQLFNSIVRDTIEERPVTDVDVVFALGTSGEHADEMFEKEKEFVNGFIDASNYGDTDYAFIEFCDPLKLHFSFKDFNNNKDIKNKICSLSRHGDGTSMAEALRKAHELFTNDSRSSSHKVLIVMTNGHLSGRAGELRNGAKALQKIGVKVITVAIGDDVDHDVIRQLSCDEGNVIHVKKDEDVGCLVYVITREAVKGTPVYDEVVKEETFLRQVFLQPRVNLILKPSTSTTEQAQIDEEAKRLEREQLEAEKRAEEETLKFEEIERQLEEKEEEARLEIERLEIEELERKQKEKEEFERKKREEEEAQRKKKEEEEEELAMMQFAVATPETEIIRKAHERTLDLNEAVPEKASFHRVTNDVNNGSTQDFAKTTIVINTKNFNRNSTISSAYIDPSSQQYEVQTVYIDPSSQQEDFRYKRDETPEVQTPYIDPSSQQEDFRYKRDDTPEVQTPYIDPSSQQHDVRYNRDNTPEIRYSLKTDLNLPYEQGERGFVRDQIKSQEHEMKRRSMHDPRLFKTTVTNVESEQDEVFPSPPEDETNQSNQSSAEIPSVETRTVVYEPNLPEKGQEISHVIGDPVVVTMKIDESPVSEARATHVVRHTSTPAQVVTKTITIEGDGEPLTAEELAEIMNMSEKETTTLNNSSRSSFHRVERIEKVEKVVTSTQFWQSGQSFVVETGDSDADAAIMKALEDARRQDPNVKVAEVTITKQELGDDD